MKKENSSKLHSFIRIILKQGIGFVRVSRSTLKHQFSRTSFGPRIKVINLNAIDICNSKCQMCDIWKQKEDKKISPSDFGAILTDKLFKHVQHVGVTGGEPTMRGDLLEVYEVLISHLPNLKGLSIITNAIRSDTVFEVIKKIDQLCRRKGVSFSAMVSLDGVGKVHDSIRGVPGNFDSSMKVIEELREAGVSVSIGCTISAGNVWHMDEMLYFMKSRNISGRFRVAEFIKRLYNDDSKVIRNFSDDQRYQLAIFFHKLELSFETNLMYKRTYRNIRHMLLGGDRFIGCPYHSEGIVLSSEGQLSYCAPKSPLIGNALTTSANTLYRVSLDEREKVFENDCSSCIHDYHYPELMGEYLTNQVEKVQAALFSTKFKKIIDFYISYLSPARAKHKNDTRKKILIMGWYGTETVGDKGILGGIIESYKKKYTDVEFTIGSIVPYITVRTMEELGYKAEVVSSKSLAFFASISSVDEVVMGGGPLMDLEELMIPYAGFKYAKKIGVKTNIFGCGIGPLHFKKYDSLVKDILLLADEIRLRDRVSKLYAEDFLKTKNRVQGIELSGDPAKVYLTECLMPKLKSVPRSKDELCLFLREWTHEYARNLTVDEFFVARKSFERWLSQKILEVARENNVKTIRFCHMHNFVIGNDDRDFSIRFIHEYFAGQTEFAVVFDRELSTVESICHAMVEAKYNLCMRFHSVVFADTLGVGYKALDYTLGGKIHNYLADNKKLHNLLELNEFVGA